MVTDEIIILEEKVLNLEAHILSVEKDFAEYALEKTKVSDETLLEVIRETYKRMDKQDDIINSLFSEVRNLNDRLQMLDPIDNDRDIIV